MGRILPFEHISESLGGNTCLNVQNAKIPISEYDISEICLKEYIYMGSRLVAEYDPATSQYYYYTQDQIGSTRIVTDDTGAVFCTSSITEKTSRVSLEEETFSVAIDIGPENPVLRGGERLEKYTSSDEYGLVNRYIRQIEQRRY